MGNSVSTAAQQLGAAIRHDVKEFQLDRSSLIGSTSQSPFKLGLDKALSKVDNDTARDAIQEHSEPRRADDRPVREDRPAKEPVNDDRSEPQDEYEDEAPEARYGAEEVLTEPVVAPVNPNQKFVENIFDSEDVLKDFSELYQLLSGQVNTQAADKAVNVVGGDVSDIATNVAGEAKTGVAVQVLYLQVTTIRVEQRISYMQNLNEAHGGASLLRQHLSALRQLVQIMQQALNSPQAPAFVQGDMNTLAQSLQNVSTANQESFSFYMAQFSSEITTETSKQFFASYMASGDYTPGKPVDTSAAKWLMNPDTSIEPDFLNNALAKLQKHLNFAEGQQFKLTDTAQMQLKQSAMAALDAVDKLKAMQPVQMGPQGAASVASMAQAIAGAQTTDGSGEQALSDENAAPLLPLPAVGANASKASGGSGFIKMMEQAQAQQENSPADQAMAKVKLALKNGESKIQIQLQPAELGKLDIRMEINSDGETKLKFTADNVRALELLRNDVKAMERMLLDIGLKADAGNLSFHLRDEGQPGQGHQQQGQGDASHQTHTAASSSEEDELPGATTQHYVVADDGLDIHI